MTTDWAKLQDIPDAKLTPMLRQFVQAKAEAGDALLFFRMGDFYELFFDDAVEAAELLGLALTSRDGADAERRIPMAGVPVRAVDGYLAKVIRAGRTVAICDQVEDPKDAKGIVRREVIRTVTPGTVLETDLLEDRTNNFLAALYCENGAAGLAFVDVTTGEFLVAQLNGNVEQSLIDELTRTAPAEVLMSDNADSALCERLRNGFDRAAFTVRRSMDFDPAYAAELLQSQFDLSTLKGLNLDDAPEALASAGAILIYVKDTQRAAAPRLRLPRRYSPAGYVVLDGNTQRNLELVASLRDGSRRGTLLHVLDRTLTPMGARKLRDWVLHPLLDVPMIRARLDSVDDLFQNAERRLALRESLRGTSDIERLLGRISAKAGNARDVKALGASLSRAPRVIQALLGAESPMLAELREDMDPLIDVAAWIDEAVVDEPPLTLIEGGLLKTGFDPELDRLRELVSGGRDWIARLQRDECEKTGIPKLKIGYNKVFGYYLEVSKGNKHLVPEHYERKQTLVNAERYVTPELKSREEEIVNAQERMQKLEYELFITLRERIAAEGRRIHATADALATVDVLLGLTEVAVTNNYANPLVDAGTTIRIRDGRHPVVEDLMKRSAFVPNDLILDDAANMHIVTGPNMAGKSTYLRQAALIVLMAQIGSFVPAVEAQVGVVDRIFTRVGASDNVVRGESTFMVEMIETASILNTATDRSLIVLDEIGRGTSTFDGISIAWAVAEHIHNRVGAKTLFATHYHELTELGSQLAHAKNVSVAVREYQGKVIFLYRVVEGGADHSYGIQVAKLAGLPRAVIDRAREILESLESGNTATLGLPNQLQLFAPVRDQKPATAPQSALEAELASLEPDELSPREAQDVLYRLKQLAKENESRHEFR